MESNNDLCKVTLTNLQVSNKIGFFHQQFPQMLKTEKEGEDAHAQK